MIGIAAKFGMKSSAISTESAPFNPDIMREAETNCSDKYGNVKIQSKRFFSAKSNLLLKQMFQSDECSCFSQKAIDEVRTHRNNLFDGIKNEHPHFKLCLCRECEISHQEYCELNSQREYVEDNSEYYAGQNSGLSYKITVYYQNITYPLCNYPGFDFQFHKTIGHSIRNILRYDYNRKLLYFRFSDFQKPISTQSVSDLSYKSRYFEIYMVVSIDYRNVFDRVENPSPESIYDIEYYEPIIDAGGSQCCKCLYLSLKHCNEDETRISDLRYVLPFFESHDFGFAFQNASSNCHTDVVKPQRHNVRGFYKINLVQRFNKRMQIRGKLVERRDLTGFKNTLDTGLITSGNFQDATVLVKSINEDQSTENTNERRPDLNFPINNAIRIGNQISYSAYNTSLGHNRSIKNTVFDDTMTFNSNNPTKNNNTEYTDSNCYLSSPKTISQTYSISNIKRGDINDLKKDYSNCHREYKVTKSSNTTESPRSFENKDDYKCSYENPHKDNKTHYFDSDCYNDFSNEINNVSRVNCCSPTTYKPEKIDEISHCLKNSENHKVPGKPFVGFVEGDFKDASLHKILAKYTDSRDYSTGNNKCESFKFDADDIQRNNSSKNSKNLYRNSNLKKNSKKGNYDSKYQLEKPGVMPNEKCEFQALTSKIRELHNVSRIDKDGFNGNFVDNHIESSSGNQNGFNYNFLDWNLVPTTHMKFNPQDFSTDNFLKDREGVDLLKSGGARKHSQYEKPLFEADYYQENRLKNSFSSLMDHVRSGVKNISSSNQHGKVQFDSNWGLYDKNTANDFHFVKNDRFCIEKKDSSFRDINTDPNSKNNLPTNHIGHLNGATRRDFINDLHTDISSKKDANPNNITFLNANTKADTMIYSNLNPTLIKIADSNSSTRIIVNKQDNIYSKNNTAECQTYHSRLMYSGNCELEHGDDFSSFDVNYADASIRYNSKKSLSVEKINAKKMSSKQACGCTGSRKHIESQVLSNSGFSCTNCQYFGSNYCHFDDQESNKQTYLQSSCMDCNYQKTLNKGSVISNFSETKCIECSNLACRIFESEDKISALEISNIHRWSEYRIGNVLKKKPVNKISENRNFSRKQSISANLDKSLHTNYDNTISKLQESYAPCSEQIYPFANPNNDEGEVKSLSDETEFRQNDKKVYEKNGIDQSHNSNNRQNLNRLSYKYSQYYSKNIVPIGYSFYLNDKIDRYFDNHNRAEYLLFDDYTENTKVDFGYPQKLNHIYEEPIRVTKKEDLKDDRECDLTQKTEIEPLRGKKDCVFANQPRKDQISFRDGQNPYYKQYKKIDNLREIENLHFNLSSKNHELLNCIYERDSHEISNTSQYSKQIQSLHLNDMLNELSSQTAFCHDKCLHHFCYQKYSTRNSCPKSKIMFGEFQEENHQTHQRITSNINKNFTNSNSKCPKHKGFFNNQNLQKFQIKDDQHVDETSQAYARYSNIHYQIFNKNKVGENFIETDPNFMLQNPIDPCKDLNVYPRQNHNIFKNQLVYSNHEKQFQKKLDILNRDTTSPLGQVDIIYDKKNHIYQSQDVDFFNENSKTSSTTNLKEKKSNTRDQKTHNLGINYRDNIIYRDGTRKYADKPSVCKDSNLDENRHDDDPYRYRNGVLVDGYHHENEYRYTTLEEKNFDQSQEKYETNTKNPRKSYKETEKENSGCYELDNVVFGRYKLIKELGEGSFGRVTMALDLIEDKTVALKFVAKSSMKNNTQLQRARLEARIMSILDHPNLVSLYAAVETQTHLVLIMEHIQGEELFDHIVKNKALPTSSARMIFKQLVSGIQYMHSNNIAHRDLKPENIIITENGSIKILDFGFATFFSQNKLLTTYCGSPYYAPPEMIKAKPYKGPEADVWSLGCVLYVMTHAKFPFRANSVSQLYPVILAGIFETSVDHDLDDLLRRMICVEGSERIKIDEIYDHPFFSAYKNSKILSNNKSNTNIPNRVNYSNIKAPDFNSNRFSVRANLAINPNSNYDKDNLGLPKASRLLDFNNSTTDTQNHRSTQYQYQNKTYIETSYETNNTSKITGIFPPNRLNIEIEENGFFRTNKVFYADQKPSPLMHHHKNYDKLMKKNNRLYDTENQLYDHQSQKTDFYEHDKPLKDHSKFEHKPFMLQNCNNQKIVDNAENRFISRNVSICNRTQGSYHRQTRYSPQNTFLEANKTTQSCISNKNFYRKILRKLLEFNFTKKQILANINNTRAPERCVFELILYKIENGHSLESIATIFRKEEFEARNKQKMIFLHKSICNTQINGRRESVLYKQPPQVLTNKRDIHLENTPSIHTFNQALDDAIRVDQRINEDSFLKNQETDQNFTSNKRFLLRNTKINQNIDEYEQNEPKLSKGEYLRTSPYFITKPQMGDRIEHDRIMSLNNQKSPPFSTLTSKEYIVNQRFKEIPVNSVRENQNTQFQYKQLETRNLLNSNKPHQHEYRFVNHKTDVKCLSGQYRGIRSYESESSENTDYCCDESQFQKQSDCGYSSGYNRYSHSNQHQNKTCDVSNNKNVAEAWRYSNQIENPKRPEYDSFELKPYLDVNQLSEKKPSVTYSNYHQQSRHPQSYYSQINDLNNDKAAESQSNRYSIPYSSTSRQIIANTISKNGYIQLDQPNSDPSHVYPHKKILRYYQTNNPGLNYENILTQSNIEFWNSKNDTTLIYSHLVSKTIQKISNIEISNLEYILYSQLKGIGGQINVYEIGFYVKCFESVQTDFHIDFIRISSTSTLTKFKFISGNINFFTYIVRSLLYKM